MKQWHTGYTLSGLLLFSACLMGDDAHLERHLTKDFYLSWYVDPVEQHILCSTDGSGMSGVVIIGSTVFAVGHDDDFIIAMQFPNKHNEIAKRLYWVEDSLSGHYRFEDPNDSIYLSLDVESIYSKDGYWYHISNGWAPPDSLNPYRGDTLFFIVDIRNYKRVSWLDREFGRNDRDIRVDTSKTESEFEERRRLLGVSDTLRFSIIDF